jgi:hypothetical protein
MREPTRLVVLVTAALVAIALVASSGAADGRADDSAASALSPPTVKISPNPPTPAPSVRLLICGYVVAGGDTTPAGVAGTPRRFVFTIEQEDGNHLDVAYTAYPPGPVGDLQRARIRLEFHAGTIEIGFYLRTQGAYDPISNTVEVRDLGDFIETYPEKSDPAIECS